MLTTQGQISKKQCVEKHGSCDATCQFLALQDIPCQSHLEKPSNDDKYINKRVRIILHQTMCVSKMMC